MTLSDRLYDLATWLSVGTSIGLVVGTLTGSLPLAVPAYIATSAIFRELWNHA